jgi:hypothetical protein
MASLAGYVANWYSNNPLSVAASIIPGYVGYTTLNYNKDNFTTDNGNRFARFQAARSNMMAQVAQYRMDLRGMTNITVNKAHVFLDTAQLFMCTSAALSCAGRIGMHGSAPPGYLCMLYTSHIFLGVMYLTICLWMGIHSNMRAQCGMVSLLTRKVRLPVPPLWLIDQSRTFASGYEKQKFWDILRFPFMPHPHDAPEIPQNSSSEDEDAPKKGKDVEEHFHRNRGDFAAGADFGSTGRRSVPSWIRDENAVDKGNKCIPYHENGEGGVVLPECTDPHEVPDHFKLYMEAQKEWFPYESYHKVSLLFGVCCFFHAVCYYCIATAMSELRGFWIAWATPGLFMTAQYWLLQLDIFKGKGTQFLPHFEWFGHIAPYFATAACMCEFRFQYSKAQVGLAWAFAIASLSSHLLFACRFWDLMTPDTLAKEMPDEDGKSFWPRTWPAPLAFFNTLWQITPPKKLKKGQHCLLHEARDLERSKAGVSTAKLRYRRGKKGGKASKKMYSSNEDELKIQSKQLGERLQNVFDQLPMGKGQDKVTQFHNRWIIAQKEITAMGGGFGTDEKKGKTTMSRDQKELRVRDVSEELNDIEDELVHFEGTMGMEEDDRHAGMAMQGDDRTQSVKGIPSTPYWIMRGAVATHIFCFLLTIAGQVAEICLGSTALLSPPGEPPWIRNQKLRVYESDRAYIHRSNEPLPDWYRLFSAATMPAPSPAHGGGHGGHGGAAAGHGTSHGGGSGHDAGTAAAPAHDAGEHRRLYDKATSDAVGDLIASLPSLEWLAEELQQDNGPSLESLRSSSATKGLPTSMEMHLQSSKESAPLPASGFMAQSLWSLPIDWPRLFEPRHLACQTRSTGTAIAALTQRGVGAMLHLKNSSATTSGQEEKTLVAEAFALSGIGTYGTLVGASWETFGLRLVTSKGHVLRCHGHGPHDGAWGCDVDANILLPSSGGRLRAAAIAEDAGTKQRTVALVFEDMPTTVVHYQSSIDKNEWRPSGEMRLPPGSSHHAGMVFADNMLMIIGADGAIHHRPLRDDVQPLFSPLPTAASQSREWHSACAASVGQGVVRLALRQAGPGSWRPELVVAARKKTKVGLVNV